MNDFVNGPPSFSMHIDKPPNPSVALDRWFVDLSAASRDAFGRVSVDQVFDEFHADGLLFGGGSNLQIERKIAFGQTIVAVVFKTTDELAVILQEFLNRLPAPATDIFPRGSFGLPSRQ